MNNTLLFKIIAMTIILVILSFNVSFAIENVINGSSEENETDYNKIQNDVIDIINEEKDTKQKTVNNVDDKEINKSQIQTTANQKDIEMEYEYDEDTNQVIAKIVSKIELKDTKPSWKLSEDKLTYTKVFITNMNYETPVEDINGNITMVNVEITEVKDFKIEVKNEYNTNTNQVTAKIISNVKLKDTKPSWQLSADKLIYTKVFESNMNYETPVEDINGNVINAHINITEIKMTKIEVKYEYDINTNQVTAKIISDTPLKDTKPSWKLSEDKLTYTKVFASNMNYNTPVEDIKGNIIDVNINVTDVKTADITVYTNYDKDTNQVIAQIVSKIELKDTKPSWQLSADKLTYTKTFTDNMNYNTPVEDIYGNIFDVNINISGIDKTPPEIMLEYKYNKDDTVTVYMKSNKKLGDTKPSWTLSQDRLVYTKTFDTDQTYSTPVEDFSGNSTSVKIDFKMRKFSYNQEDNSVIKVRYLYTDRYKALVEIISSVKLQDTKPSWTLSSDGYTYSKVFYENNIYVTPVTYINGSVKNVNIIVNLFENYLTGIDVSEHQGKINWSEVKNSGIDYAIIRCGFGQNNPAQDDKLFLRNVLECERLGIPYGVYLYSYALTEQDAYSEAEHALRLIKGHNPTFGVWIDMEDADGYKARNGMPSDETLVNIISIFCDKLAENGYNTGVYASYSWLVTKLSSSRLDKYNKWVAQWNSTCDYNKKYIMWQYTSKGNVNGILTNVDMNIYYK